MPNVNFIFDADTAKAVQGFLKVRDSQKKLENSVKKTTKATDNQGKKMSLITRGQNLAIVRLGAKWLSLGTTVAGVTALMKGATQATQAAVDKQNALERQRSINFSITSGTPESAKKARQQENQLAIDAGLSRQEANQAFFPIGSLFPEGDKRDAALKIIGKSGSLVPDLVKFAEGIAFTMNNFKKEAGNVGQVANKIFLGAKKSSANPSEFGAALATVSKSANAIGASDEETIAALALGSTEIKASTAAEQIRAFIRVLNKKGIKGDGLVGKTETILSQGINPKNFLSDFQNDATAAEGFLSIFNNFKDLKKDAQSVGRQNLIAGTTKSAISLAKKQQLDDPAVAGPLQTKRLNVTGEIVDEGLTSTPLETATDNAIKNGLIEFKRREDPGAIRAIMQTVFAHSLDFISDFAFDDPGVLSNAVAGGNSQERSSEFLNELKEIKRILRGSQELQKEKNKINRNGAATE